MLPRCSRFPSAVVAAVLALSAALTHAQSMASAMMPGGGGAGTILPLCCDEKHLIQVTGEAEETVTNSITKVAISVRVSDSIPVDTTPAIDINMQMQNPQAAQAAAAAAAARGLPTTPNVKQLDQMARSVHADANKRTENVLALVRATTAERLQTQGVSLQPTSVWVPKLNQQINNGYSASNFVTFRIASERMGTLLADLMSIGATNIDNVQHIPTEEDLETGRRNAIRIATKRALARAQLTANTMATNPRLEVKGVSVSTSSTSAEKFMAPAPMFMAARADMAMSASSGGGGTTAAGETAVTAHVSMQIDLMGYSTLNSIAVNDVH